MEVYCVDSFIILYFVARKIAIRVKYILSLEDLSTYVAVDLKLWKTLQLL